MADVYPNNTNNNSPLDYSSGRIFSFFSPKTRNSFFRQGFSRVMTRPADRESIGSKTFRAVERGRVRRCYNFLTGRFGSGRVGSGRVGSGQEAFEISRVGTGCPDSDLTREMSYFVFCVKWKALQARKEPWNKKKVPMPMVAWVCRCFQERVRNDRDLVGHVGGVRGAGGGGAVRTLKKVDGSVSMNGV